MPNKNTLFVGKVVHRFAVLPSTNDYAAELIAAERPVEGTVILADHQTAGRGQMGNVWEADPGCNLTLSVILYPQFLLAREQFLLNQVVALAVRAALVEIGGAPVMIKWPNDILMGTRKVCGILIRNNLKGAGMQSSIVGIGINVNQEKFAPGLPHAGSLCLETGKHFDLNELMQILFRYLEAYYLQLRQGRHEQIGAAYQKQLFRRGARHRYAYPDGSVFYGIIRGVNAEGKLLVETEKGKEAFGIKEVTYLY